MSFLGNIGNAIAGGAEQLGGAVGSLGGLMPNSAASAATHLGHNITSGKVNFLGQPNPGQVPLRNASPAPVQNGAATPIQQPTDTTLGSLTTTGGVSGTGSSNPNTISEINQTYDPLINTYQGYLNNVAPWQTNDTNLANQAYGAQANTYQDQFNSGNANLDQQTKVLNDSYQRSLQQLGNQIRNQYQGESNALGVGGAGDSSANQMAAYALAQEQNQNRGYMNTDLNNQLTQVGLQRNDLSKSFGDEMSQLNATRDQALSDISKQYYQLQQQIMGDLQSTETAKKNAMLWTNSWAANQVAGVDNGITQQVANLNAKYGAAAQARPQSLSYQPNYQATSINVPSVAAQNTTSQQLAPSAPLAAPGFNSNRDNTPLAAVLGNNNDNQFPGL